MCLRRTTQSSTFFHFLMNEPVEIRNHTTDCFHPTLYSTANVVEFAVAVVTCTKHFPHTDVYTDYGNRIYNIGVSFSSKQKIISLFMTTLFESVSFDTTNRLYKIEFGNKVNLKFEENRIRSLIRISYYCIASAVMTNE